MFLALYWGHLLASRGQRRTYLVWAGIMGRLVMLLTLLVHTALQMSVLLAVVYFFAAMVYPAQNNIFEQNFRPKLRGRYFGLGTGIQNGVAVAASLVLGRVLDHDPDLFRVVYAVLGVCGFLYLFLLSRAPVPDGTPPEATPVRLFGMLPLPPRAVGPFSPGRIWRGLTRPFADAMRIYREDRAFNWFEINFMTYGAAFMCLSPVVPIFLTEQLKLSYHEISTARVLIGQIGVALLGPLMGRVMDRYHPVRLCAVAFFLLAFFPVALDAAGVAGTGSALMLVYLAFAIYTVGMAGVNITWNVGSMAFAPPGQGGYYQGIHVAMVGIRGTIGPLVGYAVYEVWGLRAVFWLAFGLFVAAAISSLALWRRLRRCGGAGVTAATVHRGDG
jgi:MFS family permease